MSHDSCVFRSHTWLVDRSGLALAHLNALPLQFVIEEGGCIRILPLLNEVRRTLFMN